MESRKFKKLYLTILWIVTLLAVLVGIGIHVGGWFGAGLFTNYGDIVKDSEDFKSQDITEVIIDADVAELSFSYGDTIEVSHAYPKKCQPEIKTNGNRLVIKQEMPNGLPKSSAQYGLEVTVPKGTKLELLDIDVEMGKVEINEIECDEIDLNVEMGDVDIEDIKANKGDFNLSMGDLDISSSVIDEVQANCSMGDVDMEVDAKKVDANCSMGDLDITTKNADADIDANCDLGSVIVNGKNWK